MPYSRKGNRPKGRKGPRARDPGDPGDSGDGGFGYDLVQIEIPPLERLPPPAPEVREAAPEILALGPPPADANEIQRWNYRLLSTRAWLVAQDRTLADVDRDKRVMQLTAAAARHYPAAAKQDLADRIKRDADEIAGRKRAKAAARLEKAPAAGGAKVIPIRRDG